MLFSVYRVATDRYWSYFFMSHCLRSSQANDHRCRAHALQTLSGYIFLNVLQLLFTFTIPSQQSLQIILLRCLPAFFLFFLFCLLVSFSFSLPFSFHDLSDILFNVLVVVVRTIMSFLRLFVVSSPSLDVYFPLSLSVLLFLSAIPCLRNFKCH
jgi:hypothetical protein